MSEVSQRWHVVQILPVEVVSVVIGHAYPSSLWELPFQWREQTTEDRMHGMVSVGINWCFFHDRLAFTGGSPQRWSAIVITSTCFPPSADVYLGHLWGFSSIKFPSSFTACKELTFFGPHLKSGKFWSIPLSIHPRKGGGQNMHGCGAFVEVRS